MVTAINSDFFAQYPEVWANLMAGKSLNESLNPQPNPSIFGSSSLLTSPNAATQATSGNNMTMMMQLLSLVLSNMEVDESLAKEDTKYAKVDKDGNINYNDAFDRASKSLGKLDKNGDGKVSLKEAGPGSDMYDLNGDGKITTDEDLALSMYQDKDGDGIITEEEYEDFFAADKDEAVEGLKDQHNLIKDQYETWKNS